MFETTNQKSKYQSCNLRPYTKNPSLKNESELANSQQEMFPNGLKSQSQASKFETDQVKVLDQNP